MCSSLHNNISPCVLLYDEHTNFFIIDNRAFDTLQTSAWLQTARIGCGSYTNFTIVGSVNGMVCIFPGTRLFHGAEPYYICNPFTGENLTLPKSPKNQQGARLSGFGYDSISNEYKVIRILLKQNVAEFEYEAEAEVFTLGSGGWRLIPIMPYISYGTQTSLLVNGCLHWLTRDKRNSRVILSFNVGTEEFHKISLPPCISSNLYPGGHLEVLGGCLGLVESCYSSSSYLDKSKIWVMKEYGVQTSWAKEYIFRRDLIASNWYGGYAVTKLRNGEFLVLTESNILGYYDQKSDTFRQITIENKDNLWGRTYEQAIFFERSLVSPKSFHQLL